MVCDGEAVRLVANALDEVERLAAARQDHRIGTSLGEDVLELLGKPDDGHGQVACATNDFQCGRKLSLAAVDDDEVGHFIFRELGVATLRHLAHREEIVGLSLGASDLKAPIVGLLRQAALEDDHRGDRLRALIVRDVEALHAHRLFLESEITAKLPDRAERLIVRLLDARGLIRDVLFRVGASHFDDVVLRAALRYGERHLRPLALGEPTLQKFRLLDGKRQQDLARYERRAMVVLLQECRKKRLIRLLLTAREQEVLTPDHLARAYKKDHDDRPQPRSRHADGILVARSRHDVLLLRHLAHGGELIAQTRRPLEVVVPRRLRHAARKLLFHLLRPTFEEQAYLADHRAVLLLVDRLAARRKTALDVILQAWTLDLHVLACAQREESLQELHALVHRAC